MATAATIGKYILRGLGGLLLLIVLLALLIQIPPVQTWLGKQVTARLAQQLETTIRIEQVRIQLLKGKVSLRDLYVEDQQSDTLLYVHELGVGIQLSGLIGKRILLNEITLHRVTGQLYPVGGPADSVMNYQFILDTFGGSDPAPDTTSTPSPWSFGAANASVDLEDIRFSMEMPDSTMVFRLGLGSLNGLIKAADLEAYDFDVTRLALRNTEVKQWMKPSTEETDTSGSLPLQVNLGALDLEEVAYALQAEGLGLSSRIGEAGVQGFELAMEGDSLGFTFPSLKLDRGSFRYDLTDSARVAFGFDPNHLALDSIYIALNETRYANLDIHSSIDRLTAREAGGFTLADLHGEVAYSPQTSSLHHLAAATPLSTLQVERARLVLPDSTRGENLNDMQLSLDLPRARIAPSDVAYFLPFLKEEGWVEASDNDPISLEADLEGSLSELDIPRLAANGWGVQLNLAGQAANLGMTESLRLDMALDPLRIETPTLLQHLPDSLVPRGLDLPTEIWAEARASGSADSLGLAAEIQTARPTVPVSARLVLNGYGKHILEPERLFYQARIDTLLVMREELAAQLDPSDSLASRLPGALSLKAQFAGSLDSVQADFLHLREVRDSSGIDLLASGKVDFPAENTPLRFDIELDSLYAPWHSLQAYLPDSTLPAGVQVPDIVSAHGYAQGSTDNLQAGLDLETDGALLKARASLIDSAYQAQIDLDSFRIARWLDSLRYDTLIGIDLVPLKFSLQVDGRGMRFDDSLSASLVSQLTVQDSAYNWKQGLLLTGAAEGKTIDLTAQVQEDGLEGQLSAQFTYAGDSASVGLLNLRLREANMQKLRLSRAPINGSGRVEWRSRGLTLNNLEVETGLRGVQFVYDTIRGRLDSLLLEAELRERQVQANLRSDLAQGELAGQFDSDKIVGTLRNTLLSYFIPSIKQDSLSGQPGDSLYAEVHITESKLLTSGLIPGLKELDSLGAVVRYDHDAGVLLLGALVPHVVFKEFAADSLSVSFLKDTSRLLYALAFSKLSGPADFEARNFLFGGRAGGAGETKMALTQRTVSGEERFFIRADMERESKRTTLVFQPELTLNHEPWTLPEDNRLVIDSSGFHFSNWDLQRGSQHFVLEDSNDGKDIRAAMRGLDLTLLANTFRDSSQLFGGRATGYVEVTNVLDQPRLQTNIEVDTLKLARVPVGNLKVAATQGDSSSWAGDVALVGDTTQLFVEGYYRPAEAEALDVQLRTNPLRLGPLKSFAMGNLKELQGLLYSDVTVTGALSAPRLNGQIRFAETTLTPTALNTSFRLSDNPITFSTSGQAGQLIYQADIGTFTLTDARGRQATISGGMRAQGFQQYGLDFNIEGERFLVLDASETDNEDYYGQLSLDFNGEITGQLDSIDLYLEVEPANASTFTYVMPVDEVQDSEDWSNIITFEPPETPDSSLAFFGLDRDSVRLARSSLDLYFTVNATMNDELEVTVITDPIAGDYFTGKVEGNLSVSQSPRSELSLAGRLEVVEGTYLFTYTEFVKREFSVVPGSAVTWTNDPMEPELDVSAKYTSRANPETLVAKYAGVDGAQAAQSISGRQEFDVIFRITGELDDFDINTDIEYPRNNFNRNIDAINDAIAALNQDESETNSQAFSLLLFNSFLATSGGGGRLVNLQQGFSQIITGYLNNFADQYINFVDIEFDLESRGDRLDNYFEETDFRVSLKKRFLDDRLEIRVDGVASTYDPNRSSPAQDDRPMQAYLDDIIVEYSLNPQGSLKIRVFNERDVEDLLGGEVIKLGGALVFSKSFDKLHLFGPKSKEAAAKEASTSSDN